jgi:cytochrome o ubiquinol oxidase subunit III
MAHSIAHDAHDEHRETYSRTLFGFWLYILTDCVLFSVLFAAYAVLHTSTYGGPSGHDLFVAPFTLGETIILLVSSFTCGLSSVTPFSKNKHRVAACLIVTVLLGIAFICMELTEFRHLVHEGNSWKKSAFLSSFFTLVATHGCHITFGMIWMIVMIVQLLSRGLTPIILRRLACLRLFWHFLDVVWIFIFTFVYMMGVN